MRKAWVGAAVQQIEEVMRFSLNCLKANWQQAKYRRNMRKMVFTMFAKGERQFD